MSDLSGLQALLDQALRFEEEGRGEEAKQAYEAYLRLSPDHLGVQVNYASLLLGMERWEEALAACHRVLELTPDSPSAIVNLAQALIGLGRLEEAEFHTRRVLLKEPSNVNALLTLSDICMRRKEWGRARATVDRILALEPTNPLGLVRRHNLAVYQRDWEGIRTSWDLQLQAHSGPELEYEHGLLDLLFGRMPEAWEAYEKRLLVPGKVQPARSFTQPRWEGEPFKGRTLLVHHEQGLGDTVMFARYLPRVKALGGELVLLVQSELGELMGTCAGPDRIVVEGDPLPPFDLQISLLSLPYVFRTDLSSIPGDIPYLSAPEQAPNRKVLLELLGLAQSHGLARIGIVWAGNPAHKRDGERSIPVADLAPLAGLPGVAWFSLQKDWKELPSLPRLVDLSPLLATFSDTACALMGMDLLISVDTSVAHLAGALGVPTLLLLPFQPDFRWLLERDDTPWYPTMRLYRQSIPGAWTAVVQQVLADLS